MTALAKALLPLVAVILFNRCHATNYKQYFIDSYCSRDVVNNIDIGYAVGDSALIVESGNVTSAGAGSCRVSIRSPTGYGIIVSVDELNLRPNDVVDLVAADGTTHTLTSHQNSFDGFAANDEAGNLSVEFKYADTISKANSFRFTVTSYRKMDRVNGCRTDETECDEWKCIRSDLKCDGHSSCPNNLDERTCRNYNKYNMSSYCTNYRTPSINVDYDDGHSAFILESGHVSSVAGGPPCRVSINGYSNGALHGIIVSVDALDLGPDDLVELVASDGTLRTLKSDQNGFSGLLVKDEVGNLSVAFKHAATTDRSDYFKFTVTSYRYSDPCGIDEFRCNDWTCVHGDLRCDGHNNCGNGSDERKCGMSAGSIVGICIGVLAVLGAVCWITYCWRHRGRVEVIHHYQPIVQRPTHILVPINYGAA